MGMRVSLGCKAELHRKCGGSTALFFFLGSEPGPGASPSLQKLWRVDRTFLFFFGWGSEPGTSALWRVDRAFLFFWVV